MTLDRRQFVVMAGAGLTLALTGRAAAAEPAPLSQTFLRIDRDGTVTVLAKHLDMGQGIWSGLTSIVAEELDAAWAQMKVEGAPAAPAYKHTGFGIQTTGLSTSISNSFDQLRKAGATARAMLIAAAAERWKVDPKTITVRDGVIRSGRRKSGFGPLVEAAARQAPPADPPLKSPADYRYLGKAWPRMDSEDKALGRVQYGIDFHAPDMKVAMLAWPPRFGAKVAGFDATAALAVKGVHSVVQTPQGVAVLAEDTWSAHKGRDALVVDWDYSAAETRSSDQIAEDFSHALDHQAPIVCQTFGADVEATLKSAVRTVTADFRFPYLAHAAMEPLSGVCRIDADGCEMWGAFQSQTANQKVAATILGLPIEKVKLNTLYAGGSFGRRASFDSDWVVALVQVAKASGLNTPVKLVWTREDDMRGGYFRPMHHHRLTAGLGADGAVLAIDQIIATQSILMAGPYGDPALTKSDPTSYQGSFVERYDTGAARMRWVSMRTGVPVHTFRAVSFNVTTFSKEVFMDELARTAGVDPIAYRLRHLKAAPRQAAVLKAVVEKAGYGRVMPKGWAQGLAVQESEKSYTAQVAEISLIDGRLRVEKVVCVIDCGLALNPDNVRAQVEGGIGFTVGYVLDGEITLRNGRVDQSNFHDYRPLRIDDMPMIEVHILPSAEPPTGVGEPGGATTSAAIANAFANLTGRPVRRLPLSRVLAEMT